MTAPENIHHHREEVPEAAEPQAPAAEPLVSARTDADDAAPAAEPAADTDADPNADARSEDASTEDALADDALVDGAPAEDDLAARAARADEYLALAQRKQAEFENFRKRAFRETATARERGAAQLAKELLPAIDNLERALQHAPDDADEHGFVTGVRHVHTDVVAALQRAGIDQFSPDGEPFDPTQHEAVAQQPAGEGVAAGTVLEVYQRGYRAGETVVRPARVVVAG